MPTTVSISQLRARWGEYLDRVRGGHEVLITRRGRPIARLSSVGEPPGAENGQKGRLERLVRSGRMAPPRAVLPGDFSEKRRPRDPEGRSLSALLDDRRTGL